MSETFLYLTTTGRNTGNPHTIEIWYVAHDDCYYLCAEHRHNADWVKNIEQQASVQFAIAQREQEQQMKEGIATIVTDETEQTAVAHKFDEKYNWSNGLFVRICEKES